MIVFVVPAHGRLDVAQACLAMLQLTCAELGDATAVVVAEDANLETARMLGFEAVEHPNRPLGAKLNAGYEFACRQLGADFVVPFGNDDWVDHRLIRAQIEADGELRCSRLSAVVREDGARLAVLRITYDGGDGVRVIPTWLLKPLGYRPIDDDRDRGMDTSAMLRLTAHLGRRPEITYLDLHGTQIVDFKTPTEQLNTYGACLMFQDGPETLDPWALLELHYPANAVGAMRAIYTRRGLPDVGATEVLRYRPFSDEIAVPVTREFPERVARVRAGGGWRGV